MKLVIGLGNPGKEYSRTRHNIGFYFLDKFSEKKNIKFKKEKKYYLAKYKSIYLLKPLTYMNLSGTALISFRNKYKFDDLLVIVDDVNLPFGTVRIRENGGDGGHNGLKSISEAFGSNNYKRIRIGIDRGDRDLIDHVLSKFTREEISYLEKITTFINLVLEIYADKSFKDVVDFYSKNIPILTNSLESKDQRREV